MGSKKKSSRDLSRGIYGDQTNWFNRVKARAAALAEDSDHSLGYRDQNKITKNYSRAQIVNMYETAYSELAESFHGIVDRNEELERDVQLALDNEKTSHGNLLVANNRVDKLTRQIAGLLDLMESSPYE